MALYFYPEINVGNFFLVLEMLGLNWWALDEEQTVLPCSRIVGTQWCGPGWRTDNSSLF